MGGDGAGDVAASDGGGAGDPGGEAFARVFASEVSAAAFEAVAVSLMVLDENGAPWFASPLAHTAMCPASALKVLTTGAALERLGPGHRFETRLASVARPAADGALAGDLVIVGGGDPTLMLADLESMAESLVKDGLKRIDGRIIADAAVFPEHPMNDHWNWGDIGNAYGAGAYGLNVNRNRMTLRFRTGDVVGAPAELLGAVPDAPGFEWHNLVTTGRPGSGDGTVVYSEPYGTRVTMRGTVPAGAAAFAVNAAIPDPPAVAVATVRAALGARGVEISGRAHPPAVADFVLASHHSGELAGMVENINRTSDNLEAQCLFLALAPQGDPASVVRDFWENAGVEFAGLRMLDGSGLARANMIRAADLAAVAYRAGNAGTGGDFLRGLPADLDGAVRSKPGGMSGVATSVGFITTTCGRRMTYAFMANGVADRASARALRGRLRAAIARHAARDD